MNITTPKPIAQHVTPLFTPWFTSMHPESDEGASFLGRLLFRDGEALSVADLYVTARGEFLRRTGNEVQEYGTLGNLAPEGTVYALIQKLARELLANPAAFVPREWASL